MSVGNEHVTTPIEIDGCTIELRRGGRGEPLLFLHSAAGAGAWHPHHALLAERFDVIAPDSPGFGGSEVHDDIDAMPDLVFFYLDLLDRLELERPGVVGASLGGWLAAELAVYAPDRVGPLVLVSALGLELPDHPIADLFAMTREETIEAVFHSRSVGERVLPPDPEIDVLVQDYKDKTAFARIAWSPLCCDPKLERRLRRVTTPTLVVWGDDDRVVPLPHGELYANSIPHASLRLIEECGHDVLVEKPNAAVPPIVEFLDGSA